MNNEFSEIENRFCESTWSKGNTKSISVNPIETDT